MKPKEIIALGVPPGAPLKATQNAMPGLAAAGIRGKKLRRLITELVAEPAAYIDHPQLREAAMALEAVEVFTPRDKPATWRQWGEDLDANAVEQLHQACSLPISVSGALMPDAHMGYGLPIGGVLATRGAVIPYAVGMDIACRMRLSVLDWPVEALEGRKETLIQAVEQETRFGVGANFKGGQRRSHAVMDEDWTFHSLLEGSKDKAWAQLGTSGSGNHFAEYGLLTVDSDRVDASGMDLEPGTYLAFLSHSGSRGTGARVAEHFSRLAMEAHPELPKELRRLAWLDLESEDGQAYWAAMELMGRYASANHELIHRQVTEALGAQVLAGVENHHNFAWLEQHGGEEVVVHRKGATPASEGILGVIPGSMGTPGYVVRGLGQPESLNSASHGAGRAMSRREAKRRFKWAQARAFLKERQVHLISGGLDEAPMAYKDIDQVMAAQQDLVQPIARFNPRLVKMAGD